MKKILLGLSAVVLISVSSCSSGDKKQSEESSATIPSDSSKVMMVRFSVNDYPTFLAVYEANDSLRAAYGISKFHLAREMEDSNKVIVFEKIESFDQAKAFTASPALKEAMDKAGINSAPAFDFVSLVRNDNSPNPIMDRIMIKHRVKDWDSWLKVYDAEGMKTRAENGMIDRALSRGADDPNMVYVVFAVSDAEKANARSQSPELKAKMMEAGVEGPPEIIRYKLLN